MLEYGISVTDQIAGEHMKVYTNILTHTAMTEW